MITLTPKEFFGWIMVAVIMAFFVGRCAEIDYSIRKKMKKAREENGY